MKFYVLDDMLSAVKIISNIIESRGLGEVIGAQTDSEKAIAEILAKNPDIVISDLLMPIKDGLSVVYEVHEINPSIDFIMISQVVDKNIISEAYGAKIEFFISKPINVIEVENVIKRVIEKRRLSQVLNGIRSMMGTEPAPKSEVQDDILIKVKQILGSVGMLGESGTKDIINVCEMIYKSGQGYDKNTLNKYSENRGEDSKIVKQRIRRAIKKGLTNIAAIGIEDYYSDTFTQYSQTLFNFEAVRGEMDLLRGKSAYGGKPGIDKFFQGLELLCDVAP